MPDPAQPNPVPAEGERWTFHICECGLPNTRQALCNNLRHKTRFVEVVPASRLEQAEQRVRELEHERDTAYVNPGSGVLIDYRQRAQAAEARAELLAAQVEEAGEALEREWAANHAERCDNLVLDHPPGERCSWPRPDVLARFSGGDA